jgi:CMP/dCMP kinase
MAGGRSVVLSGDLGSGKSTISIRLAQRLQLRRISVGDVYRDLARQRGMTALELNRHAELDDDIDHYVDQLQSNVAASAEAVVVDSRLAWHFFRDALKVHLITDPTVGAQRVLGRSADSVESYASLADAERRLAERSESERMRFLQRYGVDKTRLQNYDVVCDTTRASPDEIVGWIINALEAPQSALLLLVDPHRIQLTTHAGTEGGEVRLGYTHPHFFVVEGHDAVRTAIRDGCALVPATLVADAY